MPDQRRVNVRQRGIGKPYGSIGTLGSMAVRLAVSKRDIHMAQRLRYDVFFEELAAMPNMVARLRRRDEDEFDALCDHLLVEDYAPTVSMITAGKTVSRRWPLIVGTYRMLRADVAARTNTEFYTQREYDVATLIAAKGSHLRFMELGRSCVHKCYRNKRTVELLWHALWAYVRRHKSDVMIGCASFPGTDPAVHKMALSFLHHSAGAPADWRVRAQPHLFHPMDLLPADQIDLKSALRALPPLIKGYLRLGAYIGDGAVVDPQFGTTDVLIILPVSRINPRYFAHFGAPDELVC